jgi:3-oxoacyl-[acyl-carrier protein] reductase
MSTPYATMLSPAPGSRLAVVGGCGTIGRAIVTAACKLSLRVAVLDLPASLAAHPPPGECIGLPVDASEADQVAAAFASLTEQWQGLDGLINLVGFSDERRPVEAFDLAGWQTIIGGNLASAFLISKHGLPMLRQGVQPAMVHVASTLGVRATEGYGPYAAAKAAMLSLVQMLARENAPWLRVNAVSPSAVDTAFLSGGTGRPQRAVHLDVDDYAKQIPLGRIATADDVVGPTLFLLSPAAGYITGQNLIVNGGLF